MEDGWLSAEAKIGATFFGGGGLRERNRRKTHNQMFSNSIVLFIKIILLIDTIKAKISMNRVTQSLKRKSHKMIVRSNKGREQKDTVFTLEDRKYFSKKERKTKMKAEKSQAQLKII